MSVTCDKYGFFNGIYALEQSNWANYMKGIAPDGIIADAGDELEVYAVSGGEGMKVRVKSGEALVAGHKAWVNSEKSIDIPTADGSNPRNDLIVLRVTYDNDEESTIVIDVKQGTPASTPTDPTLTQNIGTIYEYPLARVVVGANVTNILPANVTNFGFLWQCANVESIIEPFSSTSVTPKMNAEHRCTTSLGSLTVNLPDEPYPTYITSIRFPANGSFTGIVIKKGTNTISGTSNLKLKGDSLNLQSKIYELVIWWDGTYYWCASSAA